MAKRIRTLSVATILLLSALLGGCAGGAKPKLHDLMALQHRADQAYADGDMATAVTAYEALTREVPQEAGYWFRLGNARVRQQQPDAAVRAYQEALKRTPEDPRIWHNLGIVRLRQAEAAFVESAGRDTAGGGGISKQDAKLAHGIADLVAPGVAAGTTAADAGGEGGT